MVDLDELCAFVFPEKLQHPLAVGRLFAFSDYGPFRPTENVLRSGPKRIHILADYELDEMCHQSEREDICSVYQHKGDSLGSLTTLEQEMIIQQADKKLKMAKGSGSLPTISKSQFFELFADLKRNEDGALSFHEVQQVITQFRRDRIRDFKLQYPFKKPTKRTQEGTGYTVEKMGSTVSFAVAPGSMFQKMKGCSHSDIIEQTTTHLHRNAFSLSEGGGGTEIAQNVRLIRGVGRADPDPFQTGAPRTTASAREEWNATCSLAGTGLGSGVKAANSLTTWKRNSTIY